MKTVLSSLLVNKTKVEKRLDIVSNEWRNSECPSSKCDREKSRLEEVLRNLNKAIFELEQLL